VRTPNVDFFIASPINYEATKHDPNWVVHAHNSGSSDFTQNFTYEGMYVGSIYSNRNRVRATKRVKHAKYLPLVLVSHD